MEITIYVIEDENGQELERTRPIMISLVGIYKMWKALELVVGIGREFEEHANFWVYRFAIEYEIEFGHHWDFAPAFVYDVKKNLYNSWALGVVIGKRF